MHSSAKQREIARESSLDYELLIYLYCHTSYKAINNCEFLEVSHGTLKTYALEVSKNKTFNNENPLEVGLEGANDFWLLLFWHSTV